ncbi:Presequence protease [Mactra antiquata]
MYKLLFQKNKSLVSRVLRVGRQLATGTNVKVKTSPVVDAARTLQPGTKLHGYTVDKVDEVPELFLITVSLTHDKTGAQHLHVARDDDNNSFSVAFKTTPMDSTGVPHILEHTVLCGSNKYPVRDPFFKMLNRSLATFMNAMTASDWTMYPFSTQNRQDYNNLLSIYLDAVFYPQLREFDFCQEGWRLEHDDLKDPNSPINFKGVVYNEMKGVFSSQDNIFAQAVQNKLTPSHTYGVVSGGDPENIPDLTWNHLRNFHQSHYHPSNSKFFTYGNFPLEEHLEFINENYLVRFDKIDVNTAVPVEPRWNQPKEERISCQPDTMCPDPNKQTTLSVNFLLSDITDIEECTTIMILSSLLIDGETSPFYRSLLEANIGSSYAPVNGYNGYTREGTFSVGLKGIHENDVDKVKQIIDDTIDEVIRDGFEESRIDAILHRIELSTKHQSSNYGLSLNMSIACGWNHDGEAPEMLKVNNQMSIFKQKLKDDPQYLQKKVKQYLKDNPHRLTLVMSPDEQYEEKRQKKESEKLTECIDKLTDEDRKRIYKLGQDLQDVQNIVEDLTCLPCIQVNEIDRNIKPEATELISIDGVEVQYSKQPTNEVTYIKMISFLDQVPEEMKVYVPLFTSVITKMGAGIYDYKELSHQIDLHTGGLNASTLVAQDPTDLLAFEQGVMFSSSCLERNLDRMFDLWTEIFDRYNLKDSNRLQTLIQMCAAELASGLSNSGHSYAMTHSSSSLTPSRKMTEMFDGVTQVSVMKKIAELEDNTKIMEHLIELGHQILNKNNLKISVNATPDFMPSALRKVEGFIETLNSNRKPEQHVVKPHVTHDDIFKATSQKTQIELPFSVNYMSKSIQTVPYTHEDFSSLRILSRLLSWKYLHREIREKGGAYGGGANCSDGVLSFFSYRDPNSMETLEVFNKSIDWAASGSFTDTDIEEAKIAVFQAIDKPVSPGQIGSNQFLYNITDTMRQRNRDRLFSATKDNIVDVTQKYLVEGQKPSSISFLGPSNSNVTDNAGWKIIKE